ncbi:ABC transporter substrate-binding protein [Polaromonas jejuensis]|uniref:ABC transporter substrate-binding protein n=1 Tax=Polaromonas jejuensis TaxID=457502 RepID=A0ABW0Q7I9_9BURK|nr:ABC transporter substrate-binding protein [Polaromonas jejuensis]
MTMNRRSFVGAATTASVALAAPSLTWGQSVDEPLRVGLLTAKTGPLASGGLDMERGLLSYLAEHDQRIGGRRIQLIVSDTGGVPSNARTKMQELVEREKAQVLMGPLAAFEALAVDDYVRGKQIPIFPVAAAEDMTQRKVNQWLFRASSTSAQCAHPLADYCVKKLKYKRMILIADDIAYGHEMTAGFQRVFDQAGGKVVQKLFPPLTAPDYGTFLAQLNPEADAIFLGFAGSNGFRFIRQFNEYGLRGKQALVGGMTALDEAVLRNMGDEALGIVTVNWYSAELSNPINSRFVGAFRKAYSYDPGFYAACTHVSASVLDAALAPIKGKVFDKEALRKALRKTEVLTARGPVKFDEYGNVVGSVYIRRVERKEGRLVNSIIDTYPDVSQFWTYDPKKFLSEPVYSRDWPPAKNLGA